MGPEFTLQFALLLLHLGVDEKLQFHSQWQKAKQYDLAWKESSVLSWSIPISVFSVHQTLIALTLKS